MSAIVKACLVSNTIKNTGKECDVSMGPTAMLIAMPPSATFTDTDLADPVNWLTTKIHAAKASRFYPLFGAQAPIRTITNNPESDVIVTLDDGSTVFLRYGFINRMYETTSGGICYAKALQSFRSSGYRFLEIDQAGQMLVHDNGDATYAGIITDFANSPSPILADLKTNVYKNRFSLSWNPVEYVQNGLIMEGALALLSLMGLIDAEITKAAAGTTTKLKIGVQTECAETDLVAEFGADLGTHVSNFIVTNKATGAVVVPTAAAIVTGWIELTGTYVSGQTYNVIGALPSVWLAADVDGYDASENGVDILIP